MYDLVIVGAGAAGYSAAIYAARSKMNVLVIGGEIGGTAAKAYEIENYPGFKNILGSELASKMKEHVESLDVEIKQDIVKKIEKKDDNFKIDTTVSGKIESKSVILATGTIHRHLNADGEKEFEGKGVSYCATCDGFFFKDKTVAIIGGGDSAATAGLFLGEICKKVYIIYRKEEMRAEPFWLDKLEENPRVEFMPQWHVAKIGGENKVEYIDLKCCGFKDENPSKQLEVDGVFIQIGADPDTRLADGLNMEKDERNFIKVDKTQATSLEGVFAAGDATNGSNHFEQIATAVSEGAIAANSAFLYLQKKN